MAKNPKEMTYDELVATVEDLRSEVDYAYSCETRGLNARRELKAFYERERETLLHDLVCMRNENKRLHDFLRDKYPRVLIDYFENGETNSIINLIKRD